MGLLVVTRTAILSFLDAEAIARREGFGNFRSDKVLITHRAFESSSTRAHLASCGHRDLGASATEKITCFGWLLTRRTGKRIVEELCFGRGS